MYYQAWTEGETPFLPTFGWNALHQPHHPEFQSRRPEIGWYSEKLGEGGEESMCWLTRIATEGGISVMAFTWAGYPLGEAPIYEQQNNALDTLLALQKTARPNHWIRNMKVALNWTNYGTVRETEYLTEVIAPLWIEKYFKHPSYLKTPDGRFALFLFDPEDFANSLAGCSPSDTASETCKPNYEGVGRAFETVRSKVIAATGTDVYLICDPHRITVDEEFGTHLSQMGCDATGSYAGFVPPEKTTSDQEIIRSQITQADYYDQANKELPHIFTAGQGSDDKPVYAADERSDVEFAGRNGSPYSPWNLSKRGYKNLVRAFITWKERTPKGSISRDMLIVDNLAEWTEGHNILFGGGGAPYPEYNGYLKAILRAFSRSWARNPARPTPDAKKSMSQAFCCMHGTHCHTGRMSSERDVWLARDFARYCPQGYKGDLTVLIKPGSSAEKGRFVMADAIRVVDQEGHDSIVDNHSPPPTGQSSPENPIYGSTTVGFFSTGWLTQSGEGFDDDVSFVSTETPGQHARYVYAGLKPGRYIIQTTWTPGENRSEAATYQIYRGMELVDEIVVDQSAAPNGTEVGGQVFQDLLEIEIRPDAQ
jgi:hypothetical protein